MSGRVGGAKCGASVYDIYVLVQYMHFVKDGLVVRLHLECSLLIHECSTRMRASNQLFLYREVLGGKIDLRPMLVQVEVRCSSGSDHGFRVGSCMPSHILSVSVSKHASQPTTIIKE